MFFAPYGVTVEQTDGDKVKQNIVERSHRSDDEEFNVPRGYGIHTKSHFLLEAQQWQVYFNLDRPHGGINHMTRLSSLLTAGIPMLTRSGAFPPLSWKIAIVSWSSYQPSWTHNRSGRCSTIHKLNPKMYCASTKHRVSYVDSTQNNGIIALEFTTT